jgi:tRNA pseudouridine55 synthase
VNGLLIVDKPGGMTSHDVVSWLRRITGEKSIGHLGTLDPMATGVLPLVLGKFTRLAQYFSSAEKTYTGAIRFGFSTDTYDGEGKADAPDMWPDLKPALMIERVRAAAARFHGEMEQMPPSYSAKKIGGTPSYKLARAGKPVELKTAKICISNFEITALGGADLADAEASFAINISAGGYVRSVAHELGRDLGCGAHLSRLRRTQAGVFMIEEAHTLEELESLQGNVEALEALCVHPRSLLPEMPAVTGDAVALGRLRNGAQANLPEFSRAALVKVFAGQRELVGIAKRVAGTLFQPTVVMG